MTRENIIQKIAETLADIVDEDQVDLTEETEADDVDGWDSIAHVKLMIALEGAFDIRFEGAEITAPENIGELVDLIERKSV